MRVFLTLSVIFLLSSFTKVSLAQFPLRKFASRPYDSTYIDRNLPTWSLRIYSVCKYQQFSLINTASNTIAKFRPTYRYGIGLGFSYKQLTLDLGANLFYANTDNNTDHRTKNIDFVASLYTSFNALEINAQRYHGFFEEEPGITDSIGRVWRDDIRTFNFGLYYNLVFSSHKFSAASSFLGVERQLKSAGSFFADPHFASSVAAR